MVFLKDNIVEVRFKHPYLIDTYVVKNIVFLGAESAKQIIYYITDYMMSNHYTGFEIVSNKYPKPGLRTYIDFIVSFEDNKIFDFNKEDKFNLSYILTDNTGTTI